MLPFLCWQILKDDMPEFWAVYNRIYLSKLSVVTKTIIFPDVIVNYSKRTSYVRGKLLLYLPTEHWRVGATRQRVQSDVR